MTTSLPAFLSESILAHQGGWDELALVAVPIIVIAALLVLAKRRVDTAQSAGSGDEHEDA